MALWMVVQMKHLSFLAPSCILWADVLRMVVRGAMEGVILRADWHPLQIIVFLPIVELMVVHGIRGLHLTD
jgi:hypothetical protein